MNISTKSTFLKIILGVLIHGYLIRLINVNEQLTGSINFIKEIIKETN